ncbi:hypothetical protein [Haloterrigena salifodinae]|uniref:hypothetical protein n=1 Tax=Haloterrigena salifodinae TaxID=2675099 RepID=UPI000F894FEA|nr:hypothetical protein [Haloterrigena salifodinae]
MDAPLDAPDDRAVNPLLGVFLIVGAAVVCSAALGTILIGVDHDLEGTSPQATVELETAVTDDTDGFVTLVVADRSAADAVTVTATTTDGRRAIADGTPDGTAELTERREAVDDSITFRKNVDPDAPRDVELRLVARAHLADDAAVVLDRTVVI